MSPSDTAVRTPLDDILTEIAAAGATIAVDGSNLRLGAPKGNIRSELRERIRANREALIAFLSARNARSEVRAPLVRVARDKPLPLSFAQQRLWFLNELEPGNPFYNVPVAVRMRGRLDVAALHASLNEVVRRHEALRTRFVMSDGAPFQQIVPHLTLTLAREDLSALPGGERETQALARTQEEARTPFNLAEGPLIRFRLLRLEATEHLLLLTLHHIVADGWSMGVLVRELGALYAAFAQNRPSPLPELKIQYADFAQWQRQVLSGEELDRQVAYWKARLDGAPTLLTLPTDRPRPATQSHRGATHSFDVPPAVTAGLRALGLRSGGTLFMPLAAALNVLLARYSGQHDVCIGTAIANRTRGEIEPLIGFFVNTLVLRTRMEGDPSFLDLVEQLRRTALEAYAHQDLPFEQLVDVLSPKRHLSHTPLFQVMLGLQNAPMGRLALPELVLEPDAARSQTAKFDLTFDFTEAGERLQSFIEYSTDLFDRSTIERMARHFLVLLEAAVARPQTRISRLPLLDGKERRELLAECNAASRYEVEGTLHGLFEAQAARRPHAVALTHEGRSLAYGELNARANQLAHHLRSQGVGPDVLVGLCASRGFDLLVAMLAILKAGGAYLPLDPDSPVQRLLGMLDDARPALVLTQESFRERLAGARQPLWCLDRDWPTVAGLPDADLPPLSGPGHLAYVIYTSGSTGKPKGALLQHGNVLRLFQATSSFAFSERDVWSFFHSLAFDFSVWEIWGALLFGGRVVVVPDAVRRSPPAFLELLSQEGVTVLNQTPSAFYQLLEADAQLKLPLALRSGVFGGERLDFQRLKPWYARHEAHAPQLVNMYGITETTVHVTHHAVSPRDVEKSTSLIGVPIGDLRAYVLDARLEPVPPGVAGELYVAGAGLARGYLRRPELTAERFIPNPHAQAGERMYRTGDAARRLEDGSLEYLGRLDEQVKVRGYRIELGEIEAALSSVAGVRQALVMAREDRPGDMRLVAYVVPSTQEEDAQGRYALPNGIRIAHINQHETRAVFEEIFEEEVYLQNGITLEDDCVVFDVGANIGLFTLFVHDRCARPRVYSFEPVPPVFDVMARNVALHAPGATAMPFGLSNREQTTQIHYYRNMSVNSGLYADARTERALTERFLRNQSEESGSFLDELLEGKFEAEVHSCRIITLSQAIRETGVERIDLLKLDVEKSELDVLSGIEPGDWPKIRQLVIETHDIDGRVDTIRHLLAGHGFGCVVHQKRAMQGTGVYQLYAVRERDARAHADGRAAPHVGLLQRRAAAPLAEAEQIAGMNQVFDQIYGETATPDDLTFDLSGWTSSYDRQPIPAAQMHEWVDQTVARIRALEPERVLEIGCGTGLLLHRIAPSCTRYCGTDLSGVVLDKLRRGLAAREPMPCELSLLQRPADALRDLPGGPFDTVVINSVAQYFPSLAYLETVLEGALGQLGASGHVFVGDIRHAGLLELLHASMALHQAEPDARVGELRQLALLNARREAELLVDPAWFFALRRRFPRISGVNVLPKRGQVDNELTRFRYDVVLSVGQAAAELVPDWQGWESEEAVRQRLAREAPPSLAVRDIPQARLASMRAAQGLLHRMADEATAAGLARELDAQPLPGVDPARLEALAAERGYTVRFALASGNGGELHAVFLRAPRAIDWSAQYPAAGADAASLRALAHEPYLEERQAGLQHTVLERLREQLPAYMVPAHVVVLDALPLTPNGKVDKKALPAPDLTRGEAGYVAPRTPMEEATARIWAEVLGLDRVGIHDNFFNLGGHSLLATRVISKVRAQLEVELQLRALFEAPNVAELAARIEAGRGTRQRVTARIEPVPRQGTAPLSYAQNRFWFLEQYQPGVLSYSMPVALTLSGAWDAQRLARAFDMLVARHEPLRTTFTHRSGVPEQVIAPPAPLRVAVEDFSGLGAAQANDAVARGIREEAATPFHLEQGPLFRVRLLKAAEGEHVLLLTLHHILYDGWSFRVLMEEVMRLYDGLPLAPLPIQYVDYCDWERRRFSGPALREQLDYWKEQLAGAPDLLSLPTDRPRPAAMTYRGQVHRVALSPALTRRLTALGSASRATLFMVMAAAFKALFHRLTGQNDLCLGSLSANRAYGTENLIGIFANIVTLRSTAREDSSFADVLDATARQVLSVHDYPLPFELVLKHLVASRDASYTPYAQVVLNFYDDAELGGALDDFTSAEGLRIASRPSELGVQADFELKVEMRMTGDRLSVDYVYNTDLFDAATLARWHHHLECLAEAACDAPRTRISRLPLLDGKERRELLAECNAASRYEVEGTLHGLFEAQAARRPHAVALTHEGRSLAYGELNARANQLAHHLRSQGVGPDVLVGLCASRGFDLLVAMLAILKAGGAYLPLDPDSPAQRLLGMLDDARPALVLTQESFRERLAGARQPLWCLDRDWPTVAGLPDADLPPLSGPGHLAYVIYTSGSTGKPKGALLQHGNVLRLFQATSSFAFSERDVWSFFHSLAFDFSVWEIWGALLFGGRVVVVPDAVRRSPPAFLELLSQEGVTVLNQTPSAFYQLLEADAQLKLPLALRSVVFGGERLDFQRLKPWYARHEAHAPRLVNMYGITETTVHVTHHAVGPRDVEKSASLIGVPIGDLRAYVLDARLEPVPPGVAGELYVAGAGLARGYLRRPELTAERFIPNPHAQAGERMYRTGDAARRLEDGSLEYLGRLDEQVKVRGYRIELGEIEAALSSVPGVRQALVMAREDRPGEKRLVAYAVCEPEARDAAQLRVALQGTLPHYMLPSYIVLLERLPLTPNGKIDRKALPAPDLGGEERVYVAPRTPTEEAVAAIWSDVLQVARVGAQDNFFELGGHSLLATQVVVRLRDTFGAELPLRTLFETPHLGALGAALDAARREGQGLNVPPLAVQRRPARLPLSYAQERLWLLEQIESLGAAYNITGAVRFVGALDSQAFEHALEEIVRRHEALRTRFAADDETIEQLVDPPGRFELERIDLSALPAAARKEEARRAIHAATGRRFDLARGALFHAVLLRLAPEEHIVVVVMHHIVSDGWSLGVLIRELGALYTAYARGLESPLPELPVQYADYALWQRDWLRDEALEKQVAYWKQRLAGAPAALELPLDHPRPPVQSFRGASVSFALPRALTGQLQAMARAQGATLFMVLLAGFQHLLSRWSGQEDIVLGTPVAGRTDRRTEGLIGFFVNMLVLRTDVSGNPTLRQLLARARETALQAYAHQDLPFEKLVEQLNPVRDLSRPPLFQVMINSFLTEDPPGSLSLPGLRTEVLDSDEVSARFELMLRLHGHDDEVVCQFEYATDLFDRTTIERFGTHYVALLAAAVAEPDQTLSGFSLLGDAERHQLLVDWNATASGPEADCLHRQVARQARHAPDAIALAWDDESMGYGALDAWSNRMARYLGALGLAPESVVGLVMQRSPATLAACLGILKAGLACLPLDPAHPPERLGELLAQGAAALVLGTDGYADALARDACPALDLTGLAERIAASPDTPVDRVAHPGQLACLAVAWDASAVASLLMLTHRGLANQVAMMARHHGAAGAPHPVALGFEPSVQSLLQPLASCARLLLAPREEPAEAAAPEDVSLYGMARLPADAQGARIGLPAPGLRAYVLDRRLMPLPPGVYGELYVSGAEWARGYAAQPDPTARDFLPSPFVEGERLYRTGELARRRADGALEFLEPPRRLRIAGSWVELREIEAALRMHPRVAQAVVAAHADAQGQPRLVAYVVADAAMPADAADAEWRASLARRLPRHMLPSAVVVLDALPRTPRGTLDWKALPAPGGDAEYVAPRTPEEESLAAIWAEVLGVERVGAQDNFFDLGGHSLLATLMVARLREAFGVDLPLRTLFELRTLAALAEYVANVRWSVQGAPPGAAEQDANGEEEGII
ncbi:amino acid adenylation domain-containing protein [Corallococcus exiguus]|uniref:non-ribosomal peptide synthetase n=1 Tax=Corallococcus exiguus TaxID=83462 RepID=UPI0014762F0A|nr:non-ribosomal peptide synthetase [Corallococcus exiguus]NNB93013.1 amino acid adenylation domain-containing protein [Corallococcus exiguus]